MRYIWEKGKPRRVMHIQRFDRSGQASMSALCGIDLNFNRTINAPWGLGRKVCKKCLSTEL